MKSLSLLGLSLPFAVALVLASACSPAKSPGQGDRAPLAQKWLDRAKTSYSAADVDDAWDAIKSAEQAAARDREIRTWAGKIALARLDYPEALKQLQGIDTTEARGLRGRAKWYAGDIEGAADELEGMLQDPEVHDTWAKAIAGLARRGSGRKPFELSGAMIASTEMPHVLGTSLVVPLEIDGEQALALIATGTAEVTLDSATRKEPSWVSLRFGGKFEVRDVPTVVQDLSGISRQMNAPIKALLGVNLLRHVNATFDFIGQQFVVRNFVPPVSPNSTRVPLAYLKGGGMVVRSALKPDKDPVPASLLIDTSMSFPIALDEAGWKKAGVDVASLKPLEQDPKLKHGIVPMVRVGAFDVPQVPGVFGMPIADIEKSLDANVDGLLGSGLLAAFRVTVTEEGHALWVEDTVLPQSPSVPAQPETESKSPPPVPDTSKAPASKKEPAPPKPKSSKKPAD